MIWLNTAITTCLQGKHSILYDLAYTYTYYVGSYIGKGGLILEIVPS
jgi:hypothetical protein